MILKFTGVVITSNAHNILYKIGLGNKRDFFSIIQFFFTLFNATYYDGEDNITKIKLLLRLRSTIMFFGVVS